jgi:hypothetical protein
MKVVRLSAIRTGRLYYKEIFLVLISVKRLSQPLGHGAAGRIKSIKYSSGTIGNRTSNLLDCSVMHKPTALPIDYNCDYDIKVVIKTGTTEIRKSYNIVKNFMAYL